KLLEHLKAKGIYDRAIIVLCSDHGEGLNDHGEDQHSILVYREAIHVPLLLKLPQSKRANTSVDAPAALSDIFNAILRLTGAYPRAVPWLLDLPASRRIRSESLYARYHFGWSELLSVIDERYHLIASTTRSELYDVQKDPAERHDLAQSDRRAAAGYRSALDFTRDVPMPEAIDAETKAKLAALGYIGESRGAVPGPLPDPNQEIGTLEPMRKGIELASSNHIEEAIAAYREAIAHASTPSADLLLPLGNLYLQAGKPDDAQRAGELAIAASPRRAQALVDEPSGMLLLAEIASARGDYGAALQLLDGAQRMAEERELAPVYRLDYLRGDALARLGRVEESRAAYQREIAAFPSDLHAFTNFAVLQFLTGDRRGAEVTLQSMVRANPTGAARALAARTRETLK